MSIIKRAAEVKTKANVLTDSDDGLLKKAAKVKAVDNSFDRRGVVGAKVASNAKTGMIDRVGKKR